MVAMFSVEWILGSVCCCCCLIFIRAEAVVETAVVAETRVGAVVEAVDNAMLPGVTEWNVAVL